MKNKHNKLKKISFKGNIKLENILKYNKITNRIIKLRKNRTKEYKIHSDCPNELIKLYPNIVIDGQPQGNINEYYTWIGNLVGYRHGICDMLIWHPCGKFNGFAAEFKYGKNGLMNNQKEFIRILKKFGWYICEPRSKNVMITTFKKYMNKKFHYLL
jgi:hypothetical protein